MLWALCVSAVYRRLGTVRGCRWRVETPGGPTAVEQHFARALSRLDLCTLLVGGAIQGLVGGVESCWEGRKKALSAFGIPVPACACMCMLVYAYMHAQAYTCIHPHARLPLGEEVFKLIPAACGAAYKGIGLLRLLVVSSVNGDNILEGARLAVAIAVLLSACMRLAGVRPPGLRAIFSVSSRLHRRNASPRCI